MLDIELKQISPTSLYVNVATQTRLDIDNAVEYGTKVKDFVEDKNITHLVLDFSNITFISSFGLKVILETYHAMDATAVIRILNSSESIKNAFKMVGFDSFIDIS